MTSLSLSKHQSPTIVLLRTTLTSSHKMNYWIRYSWVQTIYHEFSVCFFQNSLLWWDCRWWWGTKLNFTSKLPQRSLNSALICKLNSRFLYLACIDMALTACTIQLSVVELIRCFMCWSRMSQKLKSRKNLNGNLISDLRSQMQSL